VSPVELTDGRGGGPGAKSYDCEKAWSSIHHSILVERNVAFLTKFVLERSLSVLLNVYGAPELIPRKNSASLCSLAGRYDNPIPTRCLAPINLLKIPALSDYKGGGGKKEKLLYILCTVL
jgi:hypothetical protein